MIFGKKLFAHQLVHLADLPEIQHIDLVFVQLFPDTLPDVFHQGLLFPGDQQGSRNLSFRQHTGNRIPAVRRQHGPVGQDADAYTVEFLQVGLVDHQELEPFQQGNMRIGGFQQHAPVKFQPAQLPVDIHVFGRGLTVVFVLFL